MLYTRIQMKSLKSVHLGSLAAAAGFILMVFELAAARILAPTIGSSTYVWTSVIGVIIMALSAGYWAGGRVADRRNRASDVARLFLVLGVAIATTTWMYPTLLSAVAEWETDVRLTAVAASLVLFAPASFLLGAISPYLAKLNVRSLSNSGQAIANLGALNSLGGIVGTFLTGFVLFGLLGVQALLIWLAIGSVLIGCWVGLVSRRTKGTAVGMVAALCLLSVTPSSVIAIDTASAHYTVETTMIAGRQVRLLATGPGGKQSGVYRDDTSELLFWYTQQMAKITALQPQVQRILVLGGGAYTLPAHLAKEYPGAAIDVVEIDPELTALASRYFGYITPPNVTEIAMDARVFVNQAKNRYDVVLVDVFGDDSIPESMMTVEYGTALAKIVAPHGVVVLNAIAGSEGVCGELFDAILRPYSDNFAKGYYMPQYPGSTRTNSIAVFGHNPSVPSWYTAVWPSRGPVYTDDFHPLARLQFACRNAS